MTSGEDPDTCSGTKSCDASGACKLNVGQSGCTSGNQCASGFCADGVCCNSACTGTCDACNEATSKGTCVAVKGAPRAGHTACAGSGTACAGTCDGTSRTACANPGASTSCRSASCTGGTATLAAGCDGKGACPPVETVSCAPNTCATTACAGGCSSTQPCTGNNYCKAGVCTAKIASGQSCMDATQCMSGSCVDNVCCSVTSCGTCQACTGAGGTCVSVKNGDDPNSCTGATMCDANGACKKKQGQSCTPSNMDCATGFCADGFCCNSACGGQCQSCGETGSVGTCTRLTTGAPRTGHMACTAISPTCAGHCDGSSDTQCGYPGSGTSCSSASCSADLTAASSATVCNGGGACTTPLPTNCNSMGSYCSNGACTSKIGNGGGCQSNIQCTTGNCSNNTCCATGLTGCSGVCVDTTKNASNCGKCGMSCMPGQSCVMSGCTCPQKSAANLLNNPGFDGSSSWTLQGPGVLYNKNVDVNNCSGSGVMELQNISDSISQMRSALPNTVYYFGFRVRVAAGNNNPTVSCAVDFNSVQNGSNAFVSAGIDWTNGDGSVRSEVDSTNLLFHCEAQGAHVYYDQVYLSADPAILTTRF